MTAKTNRENTLEQERRFTILEQQGDQNLKDHKEIVEQLHIMTIKIDRAIENKADKADLEKINNRMWGVATALCTAFMGILIYLIQQHLTK